MAVASSKAPAKSRWWNSSPPAAAAAAADDGDSDGDDDEGDPDDDGDDLHSCLTQDRSQGLLSTRIEEKLHSWELHSRLCMLLLQSSLCMLLEYNMSGLRCHRRGLTSNPLLQEVEAGLVLVGPDQAHTEGVAGSLLQNPALVQHMLYLLALQYGRLVHHLHPHHTPHTQSPRAQT